MTRGKWLSSFAMAGAVGLALAGAAACDDGAPATPCVNVPENGCPAVDGVDVCATDVTCPAVYQCQNGNWVLAQTCPPRADAGSDAAADAGHHTTASDADIDAPPGAFGGPGCVDLQMPDCDLGAALVCGGASDCCGCQSLFVCQNGGWTPWGQCVDGGVVKN
jgi:hypothetical protein